MFGLFKKKPPEISAQQTVNDADALEALLSIQLLLARRTKQDLLSRNFTHGYFIGACDALSRARRVPDDQYQVYLMGLCIAIFPRHPETFSAAFQLKNELHFAAGQQRGGQETLDVLSKKIVMGTGLIDYFRDQDLHTNKP